MKLKERYVIVDYINHNVIFIGDSLEEIKDYLLILAEENDNDIEEVKILPLNRNKIYHYIHENLSYELEWQSEEYY